MGFIKWLIAALGFLFGGGIFGGLLGYAAGSFLEGLVRKEYKGVPKREANFSMSLLVLTAAVMRSDGRVMKSELEFVRRFFNNNFGYDHTNSRMNILRELLQKDVDLEEATLHIRASMNYAGRLQLLHYLFGIANADGNCSENEKKIIYHISQLLVLHQADYNTIEAIYFKSTDSAYTILQIDKSATDSEVKKAYRKMAIRYHPDKVHSLGEDAKRSANEKFQAISNAYETIKKERNMV